MKPLVLTIKGMSCGHCLNAVNKALAELAGVKVGSVQIGRAEVEFDPAVTGAVEIVAAVGAAGYEATEL